MCFWRVKNKGITVGELAELCDTPEKLSAWLRRNIRYVTDKEKHGVKDHWQTAGETLRDRTGDCDDFAILARAVLRLQGYNAKLLSVTQWVGYRRDLKKSHMVCAVEIEGVYWHIGNWKMEACGILLSDVADKVYPDAKIWMEYESDKTISQGWIKVSDSWRCTKPKD